MIKKGKKRILITLPEEQIKELEIMSDYNNTTKSSFLHKIIKNYYEWTFTSIKGTKEFIKNYD